MTGFEGPTVVFARILRAADIHIHACGYYIILFRIMFVFKQMCVTQSRCVFSGRPAYCPP
jgi:hypothetical protein